MNANNWVVTPFVFGASFFRWCVLAKKIRDAVYAGFVPTGDGQVNDGPSRIF